MNLDHLLRQRTDLWRGRHVLAASSGVGSGYASLDEALGGRGWPRGAVTEIIGREQATIAAASLLLPGLARLSRETGWIALVSPPLIPYAPALAGAGIDLSRLMMVCPDKETDRLWALEQLLRSGSCAAALAWPQPIAPAMLRRLQLAAERGGGCGFLFLQETTAGRSSNAALRLRVKLLEKDFGVDVLKRPGGWPVEGLVLPRGR